MSSQWARDKKRREREELERNPPPPIPEPCPPHCFGHDTFQYDCIDCDDSRNEWMAWKRTQ